MLAVRNEPQGGKPTEVGESPTAMCFASDDSHHVQQRVATFKLKHYNYSPTSVAGNSSHLKLVSVVTWAMHEIIK